MRQLARGVLATLVLTLAACGSGGGPGGRSDGAATRPVDTAALAASSRISTPEVDPGIASITVAVTSAEGVDAAGLDAAASVLVGRPDLAVAVTAPATDVRGVLDVGAPGSVAPVTAETMTGHEASAVNGTLLDVIDVLTGPAATRPDLLVIGLTDDSGSGSVTMAAAQMAVARGLPTLVVNVSGTDPDLAGAGLLLGMVTDYELDAIVDTPTLHLLAVPACEAGTVRGPIVVDRTPPGAPFPSVDCTDPDTGPFDHEADAWAAGHATLAEYDGS